MANTLGITEVTLLQLVDSTHAVNANGTWDKVRVARVTDHASNVTGETGSNTEKMAIFECKAQGQPWTRTGTQPSRLIHRQPAGDDTTAVPTNVEVIYPNWDYAEFQ